ncbi:MAG TPA: CHC2 zinc finger domain-containing protein, partial [Vicinamibacterales bacterium]
MPFDSGVVAEIQAKVDLLAYVSQYVTLKRQGREYRGLCPFHSEKTPSFYLNAEKQVWHCHGCNAGGDLIKFVERYENVDFPIALRMLATRAGIVIQESPGAQRRRSEREAIYEANAAAQRYFADALRHDQRALEYVHHRGISNETAALFGLGFAPDGWEGLTKSLERTGIDVQLAERAGLVRQKTGYYDFFRNRLMLPIYNLTGEVMAFGGRALGDETPKYLNTPNTAAYTKGHHVYGLHLARRAAAADDTLV